MSTVTANPRDLADLLKTPYRPLTPDEEAHFDEYMSFKNHSVSAANVSLTEAVDDALSNLDYYLGLSDERTTQE